MLKYSQQRNQTSLYCAVSMNIQKFQTLLKICRELDSRRKRNLTETAYNWTEAICKQPLSKRVQIWLKHWAELDASDASYIQNSYRSVLHSSSTICESWSWKCPAVPAYYRRSAATDTDQYNVGEVDNDDGCCDKQLTTLKVMFIENHGQWERNGASKSAVRHHELTDTIKLHHTDQVRETVQNDAH